MRLPIHMCGVDCCSYPAVDSYMRVSRNSIEVSEYFAWNLMAGCSVFSWPTQVFRSSSVPFHMMNMSSMNLL